MDIALLNGSRNRAWAETMVNLEARKLINTANSVAAFHLKDGLTRLQFVEEIKHLVMSQFQAARQAKTDDDCLDCIKKLRAENDSLLAQAQQLKTGAAKLYAKVEFVVKENKIVGYVISAVNIVMAGLEVFGGMALIGSMNPVGMLAGAVLVADGFNTVTQEAARRFMNEPSSQGIIADESMALAKFMGFNREQGLGVYRGITLVAQIYGVFGLRYKDEVWRLFRYTTTDYFRKVDSMPRPLLMLKVVDWGLKAKVVVELVSTKSSGQ